jgi:hypothetical protein
MAKVYRAPEGYDAPDFADAFVDGRYNMEADDRATSAYIARLAEWCRDRHEGDLVGEVVRFQIADGYAQYMVMSHRPLALIHLPIHDAWSIPEAHARGLRLSDLRKMVEGERRLAELFARKS